MATQGEITLKEYVDTHIKAVFNHADLKYESLDKANKLAADLLDKRLESMNEFRNSLRDQANKFITRDEVNLMIKAIEADIRMLREAKANAEGKVSMTSVMIATIIVVVGLILSFAQMFLI